MKKRDPGDWFVGFIMGVVVGALAVVSFMPWGASATLKGGTERICHANGDGTYSARSILFDNAGDATRLAEQTPSTIIYHINDTDTDIWPAMTYSDQYTQTYISASHGYMHTIQRLVSGCAT